MSVDIRSCKNNYMNPRTLMTQLATPTPPQSHWPKSADFSVVGSARVLLVPQELQHCMDSLCNSLSASTLLQHRAPNDQNVHVKTKHPQLHMRLSCRHAFTVCKQTLRHIAMSLAVNDPFLNTFEPVVRWMWWSVNRSERLEWCFWAVLCVQDHQSSLKTGCPPSDWKKWKEKSQSFLSTVPLYEHCTPKWYVFFCTALCQSVL